MRKIRFALILILFSTKLVTAVFAQGNQVEETIPYRAEGNLIVLKVAVNGIQGDFIYDSQAALSVFRNKASNFNIPVKSGSETARLEKIAIGDNIFFQNVSTHLIQTDTMLENKGISGIIGNVIFSNVVLTINTQQKNITTSIPYRPSFISLKNRRDMQVNETGQVSWRLKPDDQELTNFDSKSSSLLKDNIISLDFAKQKVYVQPFDEVVIPKANSFLATISSQESAIKHLNRINFSKLIFDYRNDKTLKFKGDKPVILDFWATWCGPCMGMLPDLELMAKKYAGLIDVYKINVDEEKELAEIFKANPIPLLIFISKNGERSSQAGALNSKQLDILIQSKLLGTKQP